MTETTNSPNYVSKLLNQQKVRLQQIMTTLEHELEAIASRNSEQLVELAKQKELQLEAIRNADSVLNTDDTIELIKITPELGQLKQDVIELVETCQQKNEICYLTASQNQVAIEQVKNLLVGGSKNTTYNEQGQKNSYSSLGRGVKA